MANRTFAPAGTPLIKGEVTLYAALTAAEAASPTLLKWNYPSLAPASSVART